MAFWIDSAKIWMESKSNGKTVRRCRLVKYAENTELLPDPEGPSFSVEPKGPVDFSNNTGIRLDCRAKGNPPPVIEWLQMDGSKIGSIPRLRHILLNGTLVLSPFRAEEYRQDVHAAIYRCRLTNIVGVLVSGDIRVRAVVVQMYEAQVYDEFVIAGNTAILKCQIPSFVADFVRVTSWLRDTTFSIYPSYENDGKYFVLPSGELQIQDVRTTDGFSTYRCQTVHQLTGDSRLSATSGRLFVTEPHGAVPPRISESKLLVTVEQGDIAVLPCSAQAYPLPTYSWYKRSEDGRTIPLSIIGGRIVQGRSNLIIKKVELQDRGVFTCMVQNPVGNERIEVYLGVTATLSAAIVPSLLQVDIGQQASFQCVVSGYPISSLIWMKDGNILSTDSSISVSQDVLRISSITKKHRGIYQCLVNNDIEFVQGAAELRLGDIAPSILQMFSEDPVFPNTPVSLRCEASGSPSPQVRWTLDDKPISSHDRFKIGSFSNEDGNVVSFLNISQVQTIDSGRYACIAVNKIGNIEKSRRLNVKGSLFIRLMSRKSVVAGDNIIIHCPYGGHPVDSIIWEKGGLRLPVNHLQVVFPNGTLKLQSVQRTEDAGTYTCIIRNKEGQMAQRDLEVMVLVPPKINPTSFQNTRLQEGSHARIICAVVEGDLPIAFTWLKERRAIPSELGIAIRDFDEFSSVLTISKASTEHGGNYTCVARNAAASDSYTALITVNVSPHIIPFSFQDDFLFENSLARVACVVSQGDLPLLITWTKDGGILTPELGVTVREFDEHSSVLSINRVTAQNNGNYTCIAQNPAGTDTYTAQLAVKVPPRWILQPQDVTTFVGLKIVIDCQATGSPMPSIKWLKAVESSPGEYEEIRQSDLSINQLENGSLVLESAMEEHDGMYLCRASNSVGNGLSKVVNLNVRVPVKFDEKSQNITVRSGENAKLQCSTRGDRPIRLTWSRNQERITPSLNSRITVHESETEDGITTELMISNVQRTDSATFYCLAENSFSKDEFQINLLIIEAPEPPKEVLLVNYSSRSVSLSWNSAYDGNSPITHFIVQIKPMSESWLKSKNSTVIGKELTTIMKDLMPALTYQVRVFALNIAGVSNPSSPITFTTSEEAPSGPPQHVKAEVKDSQLVKVKWKPPRKDQWNGIIRGYYVGYKAHESSEPYSFLTVEITGTTSDDLVVNLEDLQPFTKYSIVVQAFNNVGTSPRSEEIVVLTSESAPSLPPQKVRCTPLSGYSLQLTWDSPLAGSINGVLQGYRVIYKADDDSYEETKVQTKVTTGLSTVVSGLRKFTNYSLQVLAFTRIGDGPRTEPVFCTTHQDIPEAPSDIKVVVTSLDSVLVAWKPPSLPNGIIKKYTVYMRGFEHGKEDIVKYSLNASDTSFETTNLKKNRRYEYWVTASTIIGEGQSTPIVTASTSGPVVPAKLISFGGSLQVPWKTTVDLPCKATGIPPPDREWKYQGKSFINKEMVFIQTDGTLRFKEVQINDNGNYTCHVSNTYGSDSITYSLSVQVPPKAPIFNVASTTSTSLEIRWRHKDKSKIPLQGYYLYYKREFGEWDEVFLGSEYDRYLITKLDCGTRYQIYIVAINKLGSGEPSEYLTAKTYGEAPIQPLKKAFIREDITFVTLLLEAWASGGCPILYFVVQYRKLSQNAWKLVSNNVLLQQKEFLLPDLSPATWYALRIIAHNNAGSTIADYEFATRTVAGGTISPLSAMEKNASRLPFYSDFRFILSVFVFVLIVVIILSIAYIYISKRKKSEENKTDLSPKSQPNLCSRLKSDCEKYSSVESFSVLFDNPNKILPNDPDSEFSSKGADNVPAYASSKIVNCKDTELMTFKQKATAPIYPHVGLRTDMRDGTYPRSRRLNLQHLQQSPRDDSVYTAEYSTPVLETDDMNLPDDNQQHVAETWLIRPAGLLAFGQQVPDLLEHGPESSSSNDTSPDVHSLETPHRQKGRVRSIGRDEPSGLKSDLSSEETTFIFNHADPKGYEEEEISDTECDRAMFKSKATKYNRAPGQRVNSTPLFPGKLRNYFDDNTIAV